MVRKLGEKDRAEVMEYVSAEPSINLFIIGDIELVGFDKDFAKATYGIQSTATYRVFL